MKTNLTRINSTRMRRAAKSLAMQATALVLATTLLSGCSWSMSWATLQTSMYGVRIGGTVDVAINTTETALMPAAVSIYQNGYTSLESKYGLGLCWGEFTELGGEMCLMLHLHHVKLPWYSEPFGSSWGNVTSGYPTDTNDFHDSLALTIWNHALNRPSCMTAHLTLYNLGWNHWMSQGKGGVCH